MEVLAGALKAVRAYYGCLEEAERCMKAIGERYIKLQEELFDKDFKEKTHHQANVYVNNRFTYFPECLAEKVKGVYRGGMVGVRGGLTTCVDGKRVGWAAIDFLETAYWSREGLDCDIIDALGPDIENYAKQFADAAAVPEAVTSAKQNLCLKLQRIRESNFEHLACTKRMFRREYLENAYEKTRVELDVDENHIGKYLPELKDVIPEENGAGDLYYMSVVKRMLWNLVIQLNPLMGQEV